MPLYESVIICRQDITKNQLDIIISEFKKNIENENGKILSEEYWGLKNLAYEINKNKKAHYSFQKNRKFDFSHLKVLKAKEYVLKIIV